MRIREALLKANEISALGNEFLQKEEPWKKEGKEAEQIIAQALDLCKVLALAYYPFTPSACEKLWGLLGLKGKPESYEQAFEELPEGTKIKKPEILFEKLEHKKVEKLKQKFG